jgi:hypothetical protein
VPTSTATTRFRICFPRLVFRCFFDRKCSPRLAQNGTIFEMCQPDRPHQKRVWRCPRGYNEGIDAVSQAGRLCLEFGSLFIGCCSPLIAISELSPPNRARVKPSLRRRLRPGTTHYKAASFARISPDCHVPLYSHRLNLPRKLLSR